MARNVTCDVTISRLGGNGDGIAQFAQEKIYVPFTLPGDIATVRLGSSHEGRRRGELLSLNNAGDGRIDPVCTHFQICGGCTMQHASISLYRTWKQNLLLGALARRDIQTEIAPLVSVSPKTRRRVDFHARLVGKALLLGFHEANSRKIVDIQECTVCRAEIIALLHPLRAVLTSVIPAGPGIDIKIAWLDNGADITIIGQINDDHSGRDQLIKFGQAHDIARITLQKTTSGPPELLLLQRSPTVTFDGVPVHPPPGGFLQACTEAEQFMQAEAAAQAKAAKRAVDLFSGVGTFSLPLARYANVEAYEADPDAVDALRTASNRCQRQLRVTKRDLVRQPLDRTELDKVDIVVFDPPRNGAREQALALAKSAVPKIVGISCNPNTFARDAKILIDGGYRLNKVTPIDQFLWSAHLEMIGVFTRP